MKVVLAILSRNGLDQPDARPLYAYGVTDAEREELCVNRRLSGSKPRLRDPARQCPAPGDPCRAWLLASPLDATRRTASSDAQEAERSLPPCHNRARPSLAGRGQVGMRDDHQLEPPLPQDTLSPAPPKLDLWAHLQDAGQEEIIEAMAVMAPGPCVLAEPVMPEGMRADLAPDWMGPGRVLRLGKDLQRPRLVQRGQDRAEHRPIRRECHICRGRGDQPVFALRDMPLGQLAQLGQVAVGIWAREQRRKAVCRYTAPRALVIAGSDRGQLLTLTEILRSLWTETLNRSITSEPFTPPYQSIRNSTNFSRSLPPFSRS